MRRQTPASRPIVLPKGYSIDLDSTADGWGIAASKVRGHDFWNRQSADQVSTPDDVAVATATATYADCAATTTRQRGIAGGQLVGNAVFCVRTTEGRWARVTFAGPRGGAGELTIHVLVWE